MDLNREPGEASSGDEEKLTEKHHKRKSSKKEKKERTLESGEKREHRHKKSKKSKSERKKSRSRSPLPSSPLPEAGSSLSVAPISDNSGRKNSKGNDHPSGGGAHVADTFANSGKSAAKSTTTSSAASSAKMDLPVASAVVVDASSLNSGQRMEEMSIEETNKVRAKLGLKPLQIDGAKNADGSLVVTKKQEDIHAPPVNMGQVKQATLIKEKIETRQGQRRLQNKLRRVKPLVATAGSDEEESAEAWADRNRREARLKAAEREKLQAEQDAEEEKEEVRRQPSYTMSDLKGLRVEHDMEKFQEGRDVILTLKDAGVLDDEAGDVLVSTALNEEERLRRNLENRKKKAAYNPYENADDVEMLGIAAGPKLLTKYDETIGGEKKKAFVIGAGGSSNAAMAFRQQQQTEVQRNLHDLMSAPQMLAREYYTDEEMATKFKKVKKMRKPRSGTAEEDGKGSTAKIRSRIIDDEDGPPLPTARPSTVDEEADDVELHLALTRTRRLKQQEASAPPIKSEPMDTSDDYHSHKTALPPAAASTSSDVYLDETSEFCRAVGGRPDSSRPPQVAVTREEVAVEQDYEEPMDMDVDMDMDDRDDGGGRDDRNGKAGGGGGGEDVKGGWSEVQFEAEPANLGSDEEEDGRGGGGAGQSARKRGGGATTRLDSQGRRVVVKSVMDDEPTCERGVGNALNLIVKKNLLANEDASRHPTVFNDGKPSSIPAQSYVVDDKVIEDDKRGRHERYMGPTVPFKEKLGYKPSFKLAYHDAAGRNMNSKEAFRDLSHKFHGKGPGKMKTERRSKKYLEEKLMMEMSSTDTPLHTVQKMQQKQQELQTPYILLSGAASAKGPTPISKKSNY